MDSPIGNEEQRGVSGGQRKRVNIGMEVSLYIYK
jgi:ABC-type multidrug transport system ATPase subunit